MAVYPERRRGALTGKWVAEVTAHGERRRKRFSTKLEADRWADFTKVTGAAPVEAPAAPIGPTLGAVATEAREHHAGWQTTRDHSRLQRLEYVVSVLGRDTPIVAVRAKDLDRLVSSLKSRPGNKGKLSAGTINRYLSIASALLTFAHKREYIVGAPVVPWQQEDGRRIHWLPAEAEASVVNALIAMGQDDCALTVEVLTATGLRWGEFDGLEASQVVPEGENCWVKLDKTKTNTPRDVPIPIELGACLREMIERNAVPNYYTFGKFLKEALKSVGQSEALTIHCLRHTTATRLVHADVNLATVKDFMGHSSLNTTLKYTHVSKELLQDASKKLSPRSGQAHENAPQVYASSVKEVPAEEPFVETQSVVSAATTVAQSDEK